MERCILKEYRIPKLSYDINVKSKKQIVVSFENAVKIATSDSKIKNGMVKIKTNIKDSDNEIKYNIEIEGVFEFLDETLDDKVKGEILKNEAFPVLYEKLRESVNNISNITHQKVPELLSFDEIVKE